jgi:1,4-dihydroxy-2-naphthoate octaprenyltransferase
MLIFQLDKFIFHHIEDLPNDLKTNTNTVVTRLGLQRSKKILKLVRPLQSAVGIVLLFFNPLLGIAVFLLPYIFDKKIF